MGKGNEQGMTTDNAAGGTPRTDVRIKPHGGSVGIGELAEHYNDLLDFARQLERELALARTMHAEAIAEWAKWEGEAKQCRRGGSMTDREELVRAVLAIAAHIEMDGTEESAIEGATLREATSALSAQQPVTWPTLEWAKANFTFTELWDHGRKEVVRRASRPSTPQGEKINAAPQGITGPEVRVGEPAAAAPEAPDDPVAVYWKLQTDADFMSGDEAIRALAAHYLHRAPEGYALVPLDRITSVTRAFDYLGNNINEPWVKVCFKHDDWSGRDSFANALATTKQEADR